MGTRCWGSWWWTRGGHDVLCYEKGCEDAEILTVRSTTLIEASELGTWKW